MAFIGLGTISHLFNSWKSPYPRSYCSGSMGYHSRGLMYVASWGTPIVSCVGGGSSWGRSTPSCEIIITIKRWIRSFTYLGCRNLRQGTWMSDMDCLNSSTLFLLKIMVKGFFGNLCFSIFLMMRSAIKIRLWMNNSWLEKKLWSTQCCMKAWLRSIRISRMEVGTTYSVGCKFNWRIRLDRGGRLLITHMMSYRCSSGLEKSCLFKENKKSYQLLIWIIPLSSLFVFLANPNPSPNLINKRKDPYWTWKII